MGRWRPPTKQGSKYITEQGYNKLNQELQHLWKEKRPEVTKSVQEAAAQGDRSENAEYIYGKKLLREIDARVRFLSKRLDDMVIVRPPPPDQQFIFFAAWVTLELENGNNTTYRIVGPDEISDDPAYISIDSPIARSLIKKRVGDRITVTTPAGDASYLIASINY